MEMKQRIIGLIVLIALAVILVPLIFDSEAVKQPHEQFSEKMPIPAEPAHAPDVTVVTQPEIQPTIRTVSKPAPKMVVEEDTIDDSEVVSEEILKTPAKKAKVAAAVKQKRAERVEEVIEAQEAVEEEIVEQPPVVAKKKVAPVVAAVEKPKSKPKHEMIEEVIAQEDAAIAEGWAVQLGVFADRENANILVKSLKKNGFHAFVKVDKKKARVLIGPLNNKNAADKTIQSLRKKLEINGIAVRYSA